MSEASPFILGAFSDVAAETHAALWDMVLSYSRALPAAWHAVNARKAVLPRLLAFLRCWPLACWLLAACIPVDQRL